MLSLFEVMNIVRDEEELIQWLTEFGLLAKNKKCQVCDSPLTLIKCSSMVDNRRWKCYNCREWKDGIRKNTFFEKSRLSLGQTVLIIYYWATDVPVRICVTHLGISKKTIVDYYNFLREICSAALIQDTCMFGGPGVIVEVDETVITKRKYNRGRHIPEQWVFGMYCTRLRRGMMWFVPNRKAETLLPYIQKYIIPGSIVMTDCSNSYFRVGELGYKHETVNHSLNFSDPLTGACTNGVEGFWSRCKKRLRRLNGSTKNLKPSYLDEYLWRQIHHWGEDKDAFLTIIEHIAKQHPL